jgi:pimeloyl-ACP methyl ester carboxylesterase
VIVAGAGDPADPETVAGLPEAEVQLMKLADEESVYERCVEQFGEDGSRFFEGDPFEWSEPDVEFLEDETRRSHFEAVTKEAFRQGVLGFAQDMFIQGQPWPFDLATVDVPVLVVHGEEDAIVPVSHSRDIVNQLPRGELRVLSGHGHASTLPEFPSFIEQAGAGRRSA